MKKNFAFWRSLFSGKVLPTICVIVGTVIGSGFLSGKEIVVFFTQFGKMSYFCIFLAFILFFLFFYGFLSMGNEPIAKLKNSKLANFFNILICIFLSSAMFAGIYSIVENLNIFIRIFVLAISVIYSVKVAILGASLLEKINFVLVPIMILFLLTNLVTLFSTKSGSLWGGYFYPFSIFYCLLYVVLNTSNSMIVISNFAKDLTKKQKVQVSFFSSLALSLLLLFANIVLLQNSYSYSYDMPLLALFKGWQKVVMSIIILFGCITTLFSLVWTNSCSLRGVCDKKFFVLIFSVFLPLGLSFCGFGFIVSAFYPIVSVIGIFLLFHLFLLPLIKKIYKKIHSGSKNTQNDDA